MPFTEIIALFPEFHIFFILYCLVLSKHICMYYKLVLERLYLIIIIDLEVYLIHVIYFNSSLYAFIGALISLALFHNTQWSTYRSIHCFISVSYQYSTGVLCWNYLYHLNIRMYIRYVSVYTRLYVPLSRPCL